jgi:hypothetical protein
MQSWARHYDAYDDMAFAVDRWREALDAIRPSLLDIARWVDDEREPPLKRWTAEAQRLLGKCGGYINRFTEGDVPEQLDTAGFEACMSEVYAKLNDLKSIPRGDVSRAEQRADVEQDQLDAAYGAMMEFIDRAAALASMARNPTPSGESAAGMNYGMAMVAWIDLRTVLTGSVRTVARACYAAGAPPIRLGRLRPSPSVIEAVADELGVVVRNAVYQDRPHPLDGEPSESSREVRDRLGVRTPLDGWILFQADWEALTAEKRGFAKEMLGRASIDFDELRILAIREAEAATAVGRVGAASDRASDVAERTLNGASTSSAHSLVPTDRANKESAKVTWQEVQAQLLSMRDRGERYTNGRDLAERCGCTEGTIRKAIKKSAILKGWRIRYRSPSRGIRTQPLSEIVEDQTGQSTEGAPHQVVLDDDVDAMMARLIKQAKPEERSRLEAMSPEARRELARTCQEQFSDEKSSSRAPRKARRRKREGG